MTNEQIVGAVTAFILANSAAVLAVGRFFVIRAIEYTHLIRDVKELRRDVDLLTSKHEQVLRDMKGLSIKIDRQAPPLDKRPI